MPTILNLAWTIMMCAQTAAAGPAPAKQLTSDPYQDGYAAWSPDGQFVVYTSVREGKERLWKVPADGGEPVQLTEYRSHHARFSPDGKYIAFDGDGGTLIQVMPSSGGVPIRVVPESHPIEQSGYPCWSPDGKRIAFSSQYCIWILDLPTGRCTKLLEKQGHVALLCHWSKKDDCIIFALLNREKKGSDLWKIPAEGGEPTQLTTLGDVMNARVSPDERLMVFASRTTGNDDIWVMSADGGRALQLTSDPTREFEACWSPKGDRLAFTRVTGRQWDIWVMPIDGTRLEKELVELNGKK